MENRVLSLNEARKIIGVSYPTILKLANQQGFCAFRIGKKWAIPYAQLMDWLAKQAGMMNQ